MSKQRVMTRASELGVSVEQRKCAFTGEHEVDLICDEGNHFSSHGSSVLAVWTDTKAPDWKYIYHELEDGDVIQCQK